ncbi:MAG: hypothetical protein GXP24_00305 [Planctomycetes bacterium]|nr:hypothetical protein [Planctomycetota bacterium]
MTKQRTYWTNALLLVGVLFLGGGLLLSGGCKKPARSRSASRARARSHTDSAFLVDTLAKGLNHLPREIVLDLQPPVPILDDAKSADGQPVLAACDETPKVLGGPYNYLFVPKGNANFRKRGVRPGDIVRYFVDVDEESIQHGIQQVDYIELTVRRLDENDPQNALIIEGGLSGTVPAQFPERIEIWRFSDKRMNEIRQRITRYLKKPKILIGWEPSPDESALVQLLERANQWLRNLKDEQGNWVPEPLVKELSAELRKKKPLDVLLSDAALQSGPFDATEGRQLQQAIWLRDISHWAKGEAFSPVEVAEALFDWTVRNIQLDSPGEQGGVPTGYVHQPWQVLMYGHGTAKQRAWVFAELCRQQQLDVVMLATGDRWWLPALLHDGQLYLFDTRLALPIPGKEPGRVATLAEVIAEPTLLSNLDVGEEFQYGTTAEDLQQVTANLVASPLQLSQRAYLLEQAFEGDDFVVFSANTRRVAEAAEKLSGVSKVQLWSFPFESVLAERAMSPAQRLRAAQRFLIFAQRPRLWKARVLHFQGTKEVPVEERNDPLAQPDLGHQQATALYQNPRIRPPNALLEKVEPSKRVIYERAKADASYWLGLLSYDLGKYKVAEDWFAKRTLAAKPEGPWTAGAIYNLARTLEALGKLETAIQFLEADKSPQRQGNLLRARELKRKMKSEE